MARIRTLKPEYPKDELLGTVSRDARLLYPLLWLIADDSGHFRASSAIVKAECFPYDEDLTLKDVRRILEELITAGRVLEYEAQGQKYGFMPNFLKHQKIDRPSQFRFPKHPSEEAPRIVGGTRRAITESSTSPRRSMGSGGDGMGRGKDPEGSAEGRDAAARLGGPSGPPAPPQETAAQQADRIERNRRTLASLANPPTAAEG